MKELKRTDFLLGNIPSVQPQITNEFDSDVEITTEQKNKIFAISKYRYDFYMLYQSNRRFTESEGRTDYLSCCKYRLSNDDFVEHLQPLTFNFNCYLYHDINETAKELDRFKAFVIQFMKDLKKEAGGGAMADGTIRNSKGRDITQKALKIMEKAFIVACNKTQERPNAEIIDEITEGARTPEQKIKARDDIPRHLKNAAILYQRAVRGTFPYDEHGEWKLN